MGEAKRRGSYEQRRAEAIANIELSGVGKARIGKVELRNIIEKSVHDVFKKRLLNVGIDTRSIEERATENFFKEVEKLPVEQREAVLRGIEEHKRKKLNNDTELDFKSSASGETK